MADIDAEPLEMIVQYAVNPQAYDVERARLVGAEVRRVVHIGGVAHLRMGRRQALRLAEDPSVL